MSTVELPLVASVRSANSSASSNRSNLHSAGSNNSAKSTTSTRSRRSQYRQQENDDDSSFDDDDEDGDEMTHKEEEPQESSELWDDVENFLNKPSPALSKLAGNATTAAANKPPKSVLPSLNGRKASSDNQSGHPSRPARVSVAASGGAKAIDPKLLQEAFAYAHQVQQMDFNDDGDGEEQQQSWRSNKTRMLMQRAALGRTPSSSSSSSLFSNSTLSGPQPGRNGGRKSSSSASGDSRKKKGKSTSSSVYSSAAKPKATLKKKRSSSEEPQASVDAKMKGHMDPQTLQTLVSNFQNGTALEELRKELAASQQSMDVSRQVLHNAAQNFFQSQ